jgi:hypothetical protein
MFLPQIIDAGNFLVFNLTSGYGRWRLIAHIIVGIRMFGALGIQRLRCCRKQEIFIFSHCFVYRNVVI